jgi:hypothetical protein
VIEEPLVTMGVVHDSLDFSEGEELANVTWQFIKCYKVVWGEGY